MKHVTAKMRSPFKWHGGKSYLARQIINLFPEHETYVEPFAGGLSVLLNKPPVAREVASDVNAALITTWRTIRDQGTALIKCLQSVTYSQETFERAPHLIGSHDGVISAAGFLIRNRMSRGGMGETFAWSDRLRGGQPGDVNAWKTFVRDLPATIERVANVMFLRRRASAVIADEGWDRNAVVYCDPPYLPETRTARDVYDDEMTYEEHVDLLETLHWCRARVFISGYRSTLYDTTLRHWKRHEFEMPNHSGQGKTKQRRIECVWEKPS